MHAVPDSRVRAAYAGALRAQWEALADRGVWAAGNVCSPVVLVKGQLNQAELAGGDLLAAPDGTALRAALSRLGYAPEDFCALASCDDAGTPLPAELLREALELVDAEAVVALDPAAADGLRAAYADELAAIPDPNCAALLPGVVARVLGRRLLALDGFEAALADPAAKQRAWAYLKQLPPEGAPY